MVDGQMVAFGQVVLKPAGRKHLARIIVDPTMRRRGHGEAFVRVLLAQATEQCSVISLNVDEQNAVQFHFINVLGSLMHRIHQMSPRSSGSRYMVLLV